MNYGRVIVYVRIFRFVRVLFLAREFIFECVYFEFWFVEFIYIVWYVFVKEYVENVCRIDIVVEVEFLRVIRVFASTYFRFEVCLLWIIVFILIECCMFVWIV